MGMQPKTKAECDREIASLERSIANEQAKLEQVKIAVRNGTTSKNAIEMQKVYITRDKGRIRELKALRRTLK